LYHSWIVDENYFPDVLEITVKSADGGIMALKHRQFDIQGVQFHPESFMTTDGLQIVRNWLTFRPPVL
jgi:anthranilate synthase component 2